MMVSLQTRKLTNWAVVSLLIILMGMELTIAHPIEYHFNEDIKQSKGNNFLNSTILPFQYLNEGNFTMAFLLFVLWISLIYLMYRLLKKIFFNKEGK